MTAKEKLIDYLNKSPSLIFEPIPLAEKLDESYITVYNLLLDLVDENILVLSGERHHNNRTKTPIFMKQGKFPLAIGYMVVNE